MKSLKKSYKFMKCKLEQTSYKEICKFNVCLLRYFAWKFVPFNISDKNTVISCSLSYFRIVSIIHCFSLSKSLVSDIYTLQKYGSSLSPENYGIILGKVLMNLYVSGLGLTVILHLNGQVQQLTDLLTLISRFDQNYLQLGNFNTLTKIVVMQAPIMTVGCSAVFVLNGYVDFERSNSSLSLTIFKLVFTVFTWWEQTLIIGLDLFVGFVGLFAAYSVVYIGVKTLQL